MTQQTFVAAWRARESFDPDRGVLRGWVVGIARKCIADAHERRARERRGLEAVRTLPQQTHSDGLDEMLLAYEIDALGDPRRTIMSLAFFEGHTHEQIADHLAMPLGTVKSWVRRGLSALKTCLGQARG